MLLRLAKEIVSGISHIENVAHFLFFFSVDYNIFCSGLKSGDRDFVSPSICKALHYLRVQISNFFLSLTIQWLMYICFTRS